MSWMGQPTIDGTRKYETPPGATKWMLGQDELIHSSGAI